MLRLLIAAAAVVAFTSAAAAGCSGHVAETADTTPITTAQISTPGGQPAPQQD